jgi:hypothetical protein
MKYKKELVTTLRQLTTWTKDETRDDEDFKVMSLELDALLDKLLGSGFFGLEGELDPRGSTLLEK